ncbi:hypothetical protein BLA29_009752 [Euroglyphus maynei]|uniref:Uncharacterized protein n=1 Tax=Euroglyphus maynei TaxID=6958 RepID=A0A1Y3AXG2_EURMA|nr:hypothetical protein BLA29_009752 [Euroglyphus maynei]
MSSSRQTLIQQEQEKVRALEEALQLLAREHHDLERSVTRSIHNSNAKHHQQQHHSNSMSTNVDQNNSILASEHHQSINSSNLSLNHSLVRSFACLSQTSMTTDMDEYFDAFDDAFDDEYEQQQQQQQQHHNDSNQQHIDQIDHCESLINNNNNNSDPVMKMDNKNASLNPLKTLTTFHTANDEQRDDLTINDSISTLSPDDDDADKTIGSDDLPLNSSR